MSEEIKLFSEWIWGLLKNIGGQYNEDQEQYLEKLLRPAEMGSSGARMLTTIRLVFQKCGFYETVARFLNRLKNAIRSPLSIFPLAM